MQELWLIMVGTVLVNNLVLAKFLGLCPLLGASQRIELAAGMAMATTFVLTLSAALSYLVDNLLLQPLQLEYLRIISFILVIAAAVQLTEFTIRRISPALHLSLGIYLPLITTNCAVLGIALLNTRDSDNLLAALTYGLGAGIGFGLILILFAALRERLQTADVPVSFQGPAIALVSAGIMSMGFLGFAGLTRG